MNVNDVDLVEDSDNYIKSIFENQKELMDKYHPIEHKVLGIDALNIKCESESSIDSPVIQLKIKDHLWRVVEEVAESLEASQDSYVHQIEELSDALHFMVEFMIFVGIEYDKLPLLDDVHEFVKKQLIEYSQEGEVDQNFHYIMVKTTYLEVFYRLGLIGNCLKNKPWKQSQMRTDYKKFYDCSIDAFEALINLFCILGLTPRDIYDIYFKKSEVNRFRQRSKY